MLRWRKSTDLTSQSHNCTELYNCPITPEDNWTLNEDTLQGAVAPCGQVTKSLANMVVQFLAPELRMVTSEAK